MKVRTAKAAVFFRFKICCDAVSLRGVAAIASSMELEIAEHMCIDRECLFKSLVPLTYADSEESNLLLRYLR